MFEKFCRTVMNKVACDLSQKGLSIFQILNWEKGRS